MDRIKWLVILLLMALCLQGCSSTDEPEEPVETSRPPEPSVSVYAATGMNNPGLRKNEYAAEAFGEENGFIVYDGVKGKSHIGIDVSSHQREIDWMQVAGTGVEYAMIRVGYRGYETGNLNLDQRFTENVEEALGAGVDVGVYFFSQAVNAEEAGQEAAQVIEWIKDYEITYPVVFNWEPISDSPARTDGVKSETVTQCAKAFCRVVEEAGYIPMVYFNKSQGYSVMNLAELKDYHFWLAEYTDIPKFRYHFEMWQYSYTGTVAGISLPVDLSVCFVTYPEAWEKTKSTED